MLRFDHTGGFIKKIYLKKAKRLGWGAENINQATAFIQTWRQMIILRVLLGISMVFCISNLVGWHTNVRIGQSGIYPGLALLISSWYRRGELPSLRPYRRNADNGISEEQQLRFAYLQAGEVIVLATGNIVNFGVSNIFWQELFFLALSFLAPLF